MYSDNPENSSKKKRFTINERKRLHTDVELYLTNYKKRINRLKSIKNPTLDIIAGSIFNNILFKSSEDITQISICDANLEWLSSHSLEDLYLSIEILKNPDDRSYGEIPAEERVRLAKELIYELKLQVRLEYKFPEKRGSYAKKTGD